MNKWNMLEDPISTRLRDDDELSIIQNTKTMLYHEPSKTTALIMDVWLVPPISSEPDTIQEDRYIRYTTEAEVKEEFSIDMDEDGWLWLDEMKEIK